MRDFQPIKKIPLYRETNARDFDISSFSILKSKKTKTNKESTQIKTKQKPRIKYP